MYDNVWDEILRIRNQEVKNLLKESEPKLELVEVIELHYDVDESWINFIDG